MELRYRLRMLDVSHLITLEHDLPKFPWRLWHLASLLGYSEEDDVQIIQLTPVSYLSKISFHCLQTGQPPTDHEIKIIRDDFNNKQRYPG